MAKSPTTKERRREMVKNFLRRKCSPHQAPSVKSVGITGQLTGSRADLMILDDIEVPGNSMTELMREKLLQLCTEAESILTPKDDSRIMYLGTPQTTFTIYRKLASRNYKPFVWPARFPKDTTPYDGLIAPQLQEDIDNGVYHLLGHLQIVLMMTISLKEKRPWVEATLCCSLCWIQVCQTLRSFLSRWLTLLLLALILLKHPTISYGAQTRETYSKNSQQLVYPGDYFYSPMQQQGEWTDYQETICSVDPSGRGADETAACLHLAEKWLSLFTRNACLP